MTTTDTTEPRVKGTWPLVRLDAQGRPMWHIPSTNPPQYAYDPALEARWRAGQERSMQITTFQGDCREILPTLPAQSVQCVVTSPPYYGLRKYSDDAREIGQEATPAEYVAALVAVFREVRRVLRDDGTIWLNLGDSYAQDSKWGGASGNKNYTSAAGGLPRDRRSSGLSDKQLIGIPWRVALALQDDGWYLRSDIIWHKPNCMPESATDRPTRAHEYLFLLSKSPRYFYDAAAVAEPAVTFAPSPPPAAARANQGLRDKQGASGLRLTNRNRRTVWTIPTQPYSGAHYATMPEALIEPCIRAGSSAQACEVCGAPWARVVDREAGAANVDEGARQQIRSAGAQTGGTRKVTLGVTEYVIRRDLGFQPACMCDGNTGSAASVVLDPFGGSGTVGRVALRLQRAAMLVELNQVYIDEHIEKRTNGAQVEMFV